MQPAVIVNYVRGCKELIFEISEFLDSLHLHTGLHISVENKSVSSHETKV